MWPGAQRFTSGAAAEVLSLGCPQPLRPWLSVSDLQVPEVQCPLLVTGRLLLGRGGPAALTPPALSSSVCHLALSISWKRKLR